MNLRSIIEYHNSIYKTREGEEQVLRLEGGGGPKRNPTMAITPSCTFMSI